MDFWSIDRSTNCLQHPYTGQNTKVTRIILINEDPIEILLHITYQFTHITIFALGTDNKTKLHLKPVAQMRDKALRTVTHILKGGGR